MNRKLKIENFTFTLCHTDRSFTTQSKFFIQILLKVFVYILITIQKIEAYLTLKTVGACRRSSREYP